MKNTGIIRKVDELGRVVLPISLRGNLKLYTGAKLQLYIDDDFIILEKYNDTKNNDIALTRIIDGLGRIVLPKELRDTLNIPYKTSLEIYLFKNGIALKKYIPNCILCKGAKNLIAYNEKLICSKCINELNKILSK